MVQWLDAVALDRLGPVWYYTYSFVGDAEPGHLRVYLVPPQYDDLNLDKAVRTHRGAWWIIGNEPNDPFQDNLSPAAYAGFFHRASRLIRRADPTARILPAGLANADWTWADAFLRAYSAQYGHAPHTDGWNIHVYVLEPDSPQTDAQRFRERIMAFRSWMAQRNEGHKPLWLTEFGLLKYPDRPMSASEIASYMENTVGWLRTTDYVQCWAWFAADTRGQFHGDLYDAQGQLSPFGIAYRDAIQGQEP